MVIDYSGFENIISVLSKNTVPNASYIKSYSDYAYSKNITSK